MTHPPQTKPKRPKQKEKLGDKEQSERFNEAARSIGVGENSKEFDRAMQKIAVAIPYKNPAK